MNRTNLIRASGLVLVLLACGSESGGGTQGPPPVRGIEGTGAPRQNIQGIQGSGLRAQGIQGTGKSAASKPRLAENNEGEAGAASAE
ncbi:MAG TPA: hypothetical protein VFK05_27245 [Polyangiaceae bacterium]|nr:hypothetical protein [Polyangiaceae bacterium]